MDDSLAKTGWLPLEEALAESGDSTIFERRGQGRPQPYRLRQQS